MTDNLSPSDRKKTMKAVKGKATHLERKLWGMLAGMGVKNWRKNPPGITGNPDVIFPQARVAVFVDGCFWHKCPYCQRKLPKTNREYWERKINRNVELAEIHNRALADSGWRVIRIWEHELNNPEMRGQVRTSIIAYCRGNLSNERI
jgi:DNA mismatch endonuclease (patch repair protein)